MDIRIELLCRISPAIARICVSIIYLIETAVVIAINRDLYVVR